MCRSARATGVHALRTRRRSSQAGGQLELRGLQEREEYPLEGKLARASFDGESSKAWQDQVEDGWPDG